MFCIWACDHLSQIEFLIKYRKMYNNVDAQLTSFNFSIHEFLSIIDIWLLTSIQFCIRRASLTCDIYCITEATRTV